MKRTQTLEIPGYQVIQFLGSGARSTIWQVRDRRTSQVYALKRVFAERVGDTEVAVREHHGCVAQPYSDVRKTLLG